MLKLWDLKKVLSYLELKGQGRGTFMGVTRPLLLGPFYYVSSYITPNLSAASVAHPSIFRLFMKGNLTLIQSLVILRMCCGSYVNMIQNQKIIAQIVDVFTLSYSISYMISIKPAWILISQYIYAVLLKFCVNIKRMNSWIALCILNSCSRILMRKADS